MPPPHFGPGNPMQMPPPVEMGSVAMNNSGLNNNNVNSSRYPGLPPPALPPHPSLAPPAPHAPGGVPSGGGGGGGAGEGNMGGGINNGRPGDDQQPNPFSSSFFSSYTSTFPSGDTPASAARGPTGESRGGHRGAMGNGSSSSSSDANFNESIAPSSITDPALRQQAQRDLQLQHQQQQQRGQQHGGQREQKQHIASGSSSGNGAWPSMSIQWPDLEVRDRGPSMSSGASSFRGGHRQEGLGLALVLGLVVLQARQALLLFSSLPIS